MAQQSQGRKRNCSVSPKTTTKTKGVSKDMKKLLSSLLAVGILTTGVVAYATDTDRIIGPYTTGDIDIEIHMGFDPTTDGPTPPNPDMWISVEIPTRILIFSDGTTTPPHTTFAVVDHTIRNFSARGVRVDIGSFTATGTLAPITLLQINGTTGNNHSLITGGGVGTIPANTELMTLAASPDGAVNYTSATFNFTGTIGTLTNATERADADLTLRLRPINPDTNQPYDTLTQTPPTP